MSKENKKHVLVIDDETELLEILELQLEYEGYKVTTVNSAVAGLESIAEDEEKYDIILTDVKMPGVSGFDLLGLTQLAWGKIPVIIISGHVSFDDMDTVRAEEKAYCYLSKPVDTKVLLEKMNDAIVASSAAA